MRMLVIAILTLAAAVGNCQQASDLRFEVASLKSVSLEPGKPITMMGFDGGPGTDDPGRLVSYYTTLKMILTRAYDLKSFQIVGPAWLDSERYDIVAKVPPGATSGQVNIMLQNLLADRFKLSAHRDRKDLPLYALIVGKDELKLKAAGSAPAEGPPPGPKPGADGFPALPPGALAAGPIILFRNGKARLQARGATIQQLANSLTGQLDRLVADETNLKGHFDIDLYWTPESTRVSGGPPPESNSQAVAPDPASPLFSAIREQLGLRVVSKKGPVDVIVVDHMERTATGN